MSPDPAAPPPPTTRVCCASRLSQWLMAVMRVVVRYRTASLSYPVVGPRSCLRRPRPRSTPSPRVPRSRGARARTAAHAHRHPPVDPPGGVGPGDRGRLDALPHPVQPPGAVQGARPPPGPAVGRARPRRGAPTRVRRRTASIMARSGQQGLEQRPPGIGRVTAGGCVRTRHPRPSPVSRFDFAPPVMPRGPHPVRHATPPPHPTCATRPDRRARGLSDVLAGRVTCSRTRPGWGGTRTGPAPAPSWLPDGRGPSVRAGRRPARRRGPPGRARAGPGWRNSRSPQQNPPRLTRCDLSSTRSASARSAQAHLAQCREGYSAGVWSYFREAIL